MNDIESLETAMPPRFYAPDRLILDGLLGPECSSEICHLDVDGDTILTSNGLKDIDARLGDIAMALSPFGEVFLGCNLDNRTFSLLHSVGDAIEDPDLMTAEEGQMWIEDFSHQRLMFVIFLGPIGGRLELRPFKHTDSEPLGIRVAPGTLVIFRADLLTRTFSSLGRSFIMSCFILEAGGSSRSPTTSDNPVAQELIKWREEVLKAISEQPKGKDDAENEAIIPREWKLMLSRYTGNEQQVAIRSFSVRFANCWDPVHYSCGLQSGFDSAVLIPKSRWNWDDVYDPDPESYKKRKLCTKHGVFIDGAELFDNKCFNLSMNEARDLHPTQRHALEIGYEVLLDIGLTKK